MVAPTYVSEKSVFATFALRDVQVTAEKSSTAVPTRANVPSLKLKPKPEPVELFGIWRQLRWIVVRFDQPHVSAAEIMQQLCVLWTHVSRPDNFGGVNIRVVIHPFVQDGIVLGLI